MRLRRMVAPGRLGMPWRQLALVGLAVAAGCAWRGPAVATPQRPTIASSPATTADGTFELEAGATVDPGDSTTVPVALKHGLGPRDELFLGWPAFVSLDSPDVDGTGDLTVGLRHRFLDGDANVPAASFELAAQLPVASRDALGNDEVQLLPSLELQRKIGPVDVVAYYQLGVLGRSNGGGTELQHTVAWDGGVSLPGDWGLFGEVAGILVPDQDVQQGIAVGGVSWAVRPQLVLDTAALVGLTDDAPSFQLAFGFTYNFGGVRPATQPRMLPR